MNKCYKIILAALLLLCLAPMPYGYYQLVRGAVCRDGGICGDGMELL